VLQSICFVFAFSHRFSAALTCRLPRSPCSTVAYITFSSQFLLIVVVLRRLSSHHSASLTTTKGLQDDHNVHSRDQCGVTYKRRLKLCALGHAAGRPLADHPSHRPCVKRCRLGAWWLPGSTRAVHLVRSLAIVPHTIGARAGPVNGTLLQGCKRLSGVAIPPTTLFDGEPFSQRCLCILRRWVRWLYRLGPAYRTSAV
jgi:hypothetical protein